jgi:SAM-dependent methyltransferase
MLARVPDVRDRWQTGRVAAVAYDSVVEHERLGRVFGWLMWGTDASRMYAELARLGDEPDGSTILDVPCGGGLAFRGLRPAQRLRYVAADLSPVMLARAREEAERRSLDDIEFVEADVEALPFDDGTFDLCVTYNSLHCFREPAVALTDMARVVRPGGELRGTGVVFGAGIRQDAFIELNRRTGTFGRVGRLEELRDWLDTAGLVDVQLHRSGALAFFQGRA